MPKTADHRFDYAIFPSEVPANSWQTFRLAVTNPDQGRALTIKAGRPGPRRHPAAPLEAGDEILLFPRLGGAADDLTTQTDSITLSASDPQWNIALIPSSSGAYVKIWADEDVSIPPGRTISFDLANVQVNAKDGPTALAIDETFGGVPGHASVVVAKSKPGLSITAYANPETVGQGQSARLHWTTTGGLKVVVLPGNLTRTIPPETTSLLVKPDAPHTIYTLTVSTADQESKRAQVVVYVSSPIIGWFEPRDHAPIGIDDQLELSWDVDYAARVSLSSKDGPVQVPPKDRRLVLPREMLPPNADRARYTLRAEGYQGPVESTIEIPFAPCRVLYYRFKDPDSKVTECAFENQQSFQETHVGDTWTLTVVGPGGPIVRHLGPGPWLEIPHFDASATEITAGERVTLSWETLNAAKLRLDPGGIEIEGGQIRKGALDVTPDRTTTYVLTATGAGETITSERTVTVDPGECPAPPGSPPSGGGPGGAGPRRPATPAPGGTADAILAALCAATRKIKPSLTATPLTPETRFDAFRITSLEMVSIIFEIEDAYGVTIVEANLDTFKTLGEARDLVLRLLSEKATRKSA